MSTWKCDRCGMRIVSDLSQLLRGTAEKDGVRVDVEGWRVEVNGEPRALYPSEVIVLYELIKRAGQVVSYWALSESVQSAPNIGRGAKYEAANMRVYMCRIRQKIAPAGVHIENVRQQGYRWVS